MVPKDNTYGYKLGWDKFDVNMQRERETGAGKESHTEVANPRFLLSTPIYYHSKIADMIKELTNGRYAKSTL